MPGLVRYGFCCGFLIWKLLPGRGTQTGDRLRLAWAGRVQVGFGTPCSPSIFQDTARTPDTAQDVASSAALEHDMRLALARVGYSARSRPTSCFVRNSSLRRLTSPRLVGMGELSICCGAHSHALPTHADALPQLAASYEQRVLFAGEATHATDLSKAHRTVMAEFQQPEKPWPPLRATVYTFR